MENYKIFTISWKTTNQETSFGVLRSLFYCLYLENDNLKQKTSYIFLHFWGVKTLFFRDSGNLA